MLVAAQVHAYVSTGLANSKFGIRNSHLQVRRAPPHTPPHLSTRSARAARPAAPRRPPDTTAAQDSRPRRFGESSCRAGPPLAQATAASGRWTRHTGSPAWHARLWGQREAW